MLGGDLCDLLILVFKMASVSGLILWKVDPDLAGVDIRECCVNIRKCTCVSGEGHVDEEKSITNSSMESVNLTLEGIGRLSLIDPVPKRDEHVSVKKSKLAKVASKTKVLKKRTKGVQNKEPVCGRYRKFGEQRKASGLAIKRRKLGNEREESEPPIKRRKFENERDESVAYAASEDNESATVIVPGINIPVVFDVKDEPQRKR